jgi:hypothetical protein
MIEAEQELRSKNTDKKDKFDQRHHQGSYFSKKIVEKIGLRSIMQDIANQNVLFTPEAQL